MRKIKKGKSAYYKLLQFEAKESARSRRQLKLYRAAINGDWEAAKRINDDCEENIGILEISSKGDTALHIATAAKRIDFVKKLVKIMNENDLAKQNGFGMTAVYFAAASGKVELAQEMMKSNKQIAMIPSKNGSLPIEMAASVGHKEMVDYLYEETGHFLTEDNRKELFIRCIETGLYDVASQLLTDYPDLATARSAANNETALHVLARKHLKFSNLANQNQQGIIKKCFHLGAKIIETEKLKALQIVERIWKIVILSSDSQISKLIAEPRKLIFDAAERGNVEFLCILIREYPDILRKIDGTKNRYTIFHIAVKNRQADIFKLIYEIGSMMNLLFKFEDKEGNNILHLAAMLAPPDRLNIVSGAALQMQRELLWFKEVEKFIQPRYAEVRNEKGFTPGALFTKEHEGLREKGEKWMKETASYCMVVAALIATVAFAAAITAPGGNNQDTGFPVFLEKASFKIFAILDAISLVCSIASISTFLSILTSRYTEEDFLWVLPRKLRTGLVASPLEPHYIFSSYVYLVDQFQSSLFRFPFRAVDFNSHTSMKLELAQNDLPRENINMMEQHAEKQSIGDADLALTVTPLIEGHMIRLPEETRIRRLKLYRAARDGDWKAAKRIYHDCEEDIGGLELSENGNTALHVAAYKKQIDFVKELMKIMNENDLKKQNYIGMTALYVAALTGMVELAKEMMKNNKNIAMVRVHNDGILPIHIAALLGHKGMVDYLYQETGDSLTENDMVELFVCCIETSLYDVASELLTRNPNLATARGGYDKETALDVLARKNLKFSKFANQNQQGFIKKCFNLVSGTKALEPEKQKSASISRMHLENSYIVQ
ncbi:Ankyrin repeat family protein [Melia azedarach]|uniref:Ankyrin repeat family protein n=1 Tax=Melia azedarach TaxID=155640 RepID=A0ACC1WUA6_MELAZ|nr:Ankyrin repeat family protein [Melia azedarach]